MNKQRKFIIVKDWSGKNIEIRFGYVFFHRDLLTKQDEKDHIDCCGGGMWNLDPETETITLFGRSDDFGMPKKENIEKALKNMDKHDLFMFGWLCDRLYEDEYPDAHFDVEDLKRYKIDLKY